MLTNTVNFSQLGDVAAFVSVVKLKSFTAAAEQLNTSKSVISKYVSRLETRLGVKLLIRTTRSLKLTEIGEAFYQRANQGLMLISDAEDAVTFLQGVPRGVLKINAPLSFGALHLSPLLSEFMAENPEVEIDMKFDDHKVDMIKGGFDVSVRITKRLEGSLYARKIAPCHHVIVASPAYVEQQGLPQKPQELSLHNVISYQLQDSVLEWEFESNKGISQTVAVNGTVCMDNSIAIRQAALSGLGVCRMPTFIAGEDIKAGKLVQLLPNYKLLELSIFLLFSERTNMAPKVRAFIDFMVKKLEGVPSWDKFSSNG